MIEALDFRSPDMSKRMNRLIQNFGRKIFKTALKSKTDYLNIKVTEVNAAYTSQVCNKCDYIDKNNRKESDVITVLIVGRV